MRLCKCCEWPVALLGTLPFNKTCEDYKSGRIFKTDGPLVEYFRCAQCGFIFTDFCDDWNVQKFKDKIYNAEYVLADPDFVTGGRAEIADAFVAMLYPSRDGLRTLDYGAGGNPGHVGARLILHGFDVASYDPFYGVTEKPEGKFDFVFSVETIEHCHKPLEVAADMARYLADDGLLFISTGLHPTPADASVLNSWYISPRNGHVSIFTLPALIWLFRSVGVTVMQSKYGMIGFKKIPHFKNQIFA